MAATSMSRMVVPVMALVAAGGIALVFAIQHLRREPPVDTKTATAAPAVSKPASGERDKGQAALAAAQADANAVATALAGSPESPDGGDLPAFDIARIEPTGDAVIAGRAAPGATVELLRNGALHDRAVADQSGQFTMVPPRLPSGTYELTLRSKHPDGKQATSRRSVAVALAAAATDTLVTGSVPAQATNSNRPGIAAARQPQLATAGATILPDGASPSAVVGSKIATVSRGDSLWRISQLTYGAGTDYAVIFKANREQIRNPNLIYPGQTFVLPTR